MKKDINVTFNITVEIKEGVLTKEVMDNYENYFHEVQNDSDFDRFDSQYDKHVANISQYLVRGETTFIEGYGSVDMIVERYDMEIHEIEEY